ncbi:MAG TPA: hypothetical protein VMR37_01920 [Rhabdochlamydiaceae bacterium]|nr:hypothetical protein [Rhabdochlamydiaceae bacterium]
MVQGQQRVEAQLDHLNRAFAEFAAARFRTGGNHSEELQDLRSRLDQLGRFCRDIEDRSKKSEAELGQKTAELERAKESMQLLREASQKSVDATRDRAQQEIDTLKAQIADLQRTHQELLKAQQKEHAKALGAIQTRLEELTAANKAQRETAETELARRGHEFAAQKSTLERQLEELKRANGNLDANLRAANETLERGLERAKQSNEAQARTVQQLEAALRFLEANKQLLSQDKDGIHRELLDAKSKIEQMADLQKQLETAQRESAAIQAKLSEQQTALAAEQEKNRQLGTNLAAAERKTADQAETIRSLQSSLEREQAEKQVANQENAREVQALIARHASDTSALERQLEEMQERLLEVAASLQVQLKHAEASRDHAAVAVQERLRKLLNSSNHK